MIRSCSPSKPPIKPGGGGIEVRNRPIREPSPTDVLLFSDRASDRPANQGEAAELRLKMSQLDDSKSARRDRRLARWRQTQGHKSKSINLLVEQSITHASPPNPPSMLPELGEKQEIRAFRGMQVQARASSQVNRSSQAHCPEHLVDLTSS